MWKLQWKLKPRGVHDLDLNKKLTLILSLVSLMMGLHVNVLVEVRHVYDLDYLMVK
jgi:hypothetical protein